MASEGTVQVQSLGCCSVKSFLSSDCGNKSLTLLDEAELFVVSSGSIAEDMGLYDGGRRVISMAVQLSAHDRLRFFGPRAVTGYYFC